MWLQNLHDQLYASKSGLLSFDVSDVLLWSPDSLGISPTLNSLNRPWTRDSWGLQMKQKNGLMLPKKHRRQHYGHNQPGFHSAVFKISLLLWKATGLSLFSNIQMISWNCYKSACTWYFRNLHSVWLSAMTAQTLLLSQILEFASNNWEFLVFSGSLALEGFQTQKEEAELAAFPRWSNFDEWSTDREMNTTRNVSHVL